MKQGFMSIGKRPGALAAALVLMGVTQVTLMNTVYAQARQSEWGIGIAAVISDEGYRGIGSETNAFPAVFYRGERFYLMGPNLGYRLGKWVDADVTLLGRARFDGFDEDDSAYFAGMEDRDFSFDMGFEASEGWGEGELSLSFLHDVTSTHEGYEVGLSYDYDVRAGRGMITPFFGLTYYSDKLVDYYYGVRPTEATTERPAYEGGSTTNIELGVRSFWQFGPQHRVIANLEYTFFGSDIEDSPLIDASGTPQVLLGYLYVF